VNSPARPLSKLTSWRSIHGDGIAWVSRVLHVEGSNPGGVTIDGNDDRVELVDDSLLVVMEICGMSCAGGDTDARLLVSAVEFVICACEGHINPALVDGVATPSLALVGGSLVLVRVSDT